LKHGDHRDHRDEAFLYLGLPAQRAARILFLESGARNKHGEVFSVIFVIAVFERLFAVEDTAIVFEDMTDG
jgi:hypothetical protein